MTDTANRTVESLLSSRAQRIGGGRLGNPRASANLISFVAGFPDPGSLPKRDITEATRVALERDGEWALQYGAGRGYPDLVRELLTKLKRDQGIEAGEENVLITAGAGQALGLICEALCDPGDVILSEEPTWSGAVHAFRRVAAEVVPVPLDAEGTDTAALEATLARLAAAGRAPKLLYMIPTFQNPTGVTTTLARREQIIALSRQYGFFIVEDDAYFDLRFEGARVPTLYSLAPDRVAYLGTFSKIMAAGMRLGWIVASPELIAACAAFKSEGGTSAFAGAVAAAFCSSGTLVEHIGELKSLYHRRRDVMLQTLAETMPEGVRWSRPEGGFFIWLTLPDGVDAAAMAEKAQERGMQYLPGTACHFGGRGQQTIRLSYSFADDEQIRQGIAILAGLIREELPVAAG
ncbi:MAG TPA: PLP-dependent aminotransferase family protein [Thermomicrobiaceae bacterium]|nr:PLP-dependent aminotransferase family protein [Thermomicrobiaceae bacterium]